jgi:hypothetical protein
MRALKPVPVDLAAWCRRESVKGGQERRPEQGVGTTPKTASKDAVFCRLPTDRQLLLTVMNRTMWGNFMSRRSGSQVPPKFRRGLGLGHIGA